MIEIHLQAGEMDPLFQYLMYHSPSEKEAQNALIEDFAHDKKTLASYLHRYDQTSTSILEYETRSTFGRDPEQIKNNAQSHILACQDCYDEYALHVLFSVYRREIQLIRKKIPNVSLEELTQMFSKAVKMCDILEIINVEKMNLANYLKGINPKD